jgi:hypothetical protein
LNIPALLWIHVLRYCVLYVYVAQRDGYPISDVAAAELVVGDLARAFFAFAAIAMLRWRWRLKRALCGLVIVESLADFFAGAYLRSIAPDANVHAPSPISRSNNYLF